MDDGVKLGIYDGRGLGGSDGATDTDGCSYWKIVYRI
jgi:hypothetical protein